jgi:hypothetical protein
MFALCFLPFAAVFAMPQQGAALSGTACANIYPLTEYEDSQVAYDMLYRLCTDPTIKSIMQKYNWKQVQLGELHPQRNSEILGVNTNNGESINVRLRSKISVGYRGWDDIYDTWLHELTHNRINGHSGDFDAFRKTMELEYFGNSAARTFFTNGRRQIPVSPVSPISPVSKAKSSNHGNENAWYGTKQSEIDGVAID